MTLWNYIYEHNAAVNLITMYEGNINAMVDCCCQAIRNRVPILICGNGGSAADAQHFSAELVGKFEELSAPYPCIALTTDTSIITAVGNDYGYDAIFDRQVQAFGQAGGVFIGISTSGNSPNVLNANIEASMRGMTTFSLTGRDGGQLGYAANYNINIPAEKTCHIQECHEIILHYVARKIEQEIM